MKKVLLGMFFAIFSLQAETISVKYLGTENPTGGMHTWFDTYLVIKNGKKCIYEYSVGLYNGSVYNRCTKKTNSFVVKHDKPYAKPLKYKKRDFLDPWIYNMAYEMISKEKKRKAKDTTITSSKNSKGQTIFCSKELKTCKTEEEVIDYINSRNR